MKENTDINVDVIPEYAAFLGRNDIKGVYVNGTTGEGVYSLTIDERLALAEAWVKEKASVPTSIIQVGGCPLRDAQKYSFKIPKELSQIIFLLQISRSRRKDWRDCHRSFTLNVHVSK